MEYMEYYMGTIKHTTTNYIKYYILSQKYYIWFNTDIFAQALVYF